MKSLLIRFSLNDKDNSSKIIARIQRYPKWIRIMPNTWIIRTSMTCFAVRNVLSALAGEEDVIFVIEVTDAFWASYNLNDNITNWLNDNV